ncbi:MAG: alpha/beta fold hydrolase [Bacteroidota bacterium]
MSKVLFPIFLAGALLFTGHLSAQLSGKWFAILDAMGTKLPMQLDLHQDSGNWSGTMSDPTVANRRFEMQDITFDGKKVTYAVKMLGITFSGVQDGKEIRGIFNQANTDFPLTFTRHRPDGYPVEEGAITIVRREQEPTEFPYQQVSVSYAGGADSVTLAGELTLPKDEKPRALVVLVSGSGPQDRNAYLGSQINHSPFLVLSDFLTRKGYGVLRYDERGVGESTGNYATATTMDLAKDAWAGVRHLRTLPGLGEVPIGMAGHSEGGIIAPIVAAADGNLAFAMLLAGPGVPIDSLMLEQRRLVTKAMGVPAAVTQRDEPALRAAYHWIGENTHLNQEEYVEGLYELFAEQIKKLPEPMQKSIVDVRLFNSQYVKPLSSPWMRYFLAFNPQEYLRQLTVPTLAINGTNDLQVPAMMNLNAISEALAVAGNQDVTVVPLIGLNHLFQPAETGAVSEYGTIETTFDPAALEVIGNWLAERF